jgi:hypothetical protein
MSKTSITLIGVISIISALIFNVQNTVNQVAIEKKLTSGTNDKENTMNIVCWPRCIDRVNRQEKYESLKLDNINL